LDNQQEPAIKEEAVIEQPVENKVEEVAAPEQFVVPEDIMEKLAEDLTKVNIMPKLEGMDVDETHVKTVVSETLKDMMPLIISHVKDALHAQNGFKFVPNPRDRNYSVEFASHPVEGQSKFELQFNEFKKQGKIFLDKALDKLSTIPEKLSTIPEKLSALPDKMPGVMEKIKEFPGKIPGAIDTLNHQISGDPYVLCAEGRYPKSVVAKGYQLKEIFSEEDTKGLLEFVSHMPGEADLAQLADVFAAYKQLKEEKEEKEKAASQENAPAESQ